MRALHTRRYKTFPPRWRNLRLPTSSTDAALATLALWSPCRPGGLLLQRLAWGILRVLGVRFLPGAVASWDPPWDEETGGALASHWREAVGDYDEVGIYERPQVARQGLGLLLVRAGRSVAFIKVRTSDDAAVHPALSHEHAVLELVDASAVRAFAHPRSLGVGVVGGWSYLITAAMPAALDRPAVRNDVDAVIEDVRTSLADLPRGADVPAGWEPMHGDLTPWNLRVRRDGGLSLVDWEDAGWGPPQADAVLLHAARRALFGVAPPALPREAADFWLQRIAERPPDRLDDRLHLALTAALRDIALRAA